MHKRILIGVITFFAMLCLLGVPVSASSSAVSIDSASQYLQEKGILQGDGQGNLMLDKYLTREEMMVIMSRLLGQEENAASYPMGSTTFRDVPHDHWAAQYIAWAEAKGITKGHDIDKFGLGENLTTWQAEAFLIRSLGYNSPDKLVETTAKTLGIISEESNNTVDTPISRGEMAILMYNTIHSKTSDGAELSDKLGLNYTFGYANKTGKLLIIPDTGQTPQNLNRAIGDGGKILNIKYLKYQQSSNEDTMRDTANNFDNRQGYIFEVVDGTAVPNKTYLLADDNFLNNKTDFTPEPIDESIDGDTVKRIEDSKNRKTVAVWTVAQINSSMKLYLAQFENQGDNALASLVLVQDDRLIFMDYPAKYDEMSTWREGDGGMVSPGMFDVLFALKDSSGKIEIGISWGGDEGENDYLLEEDTSVYNAFKVNKVISGGSRYMAPL